MRESQVTKSPSWTSQWDPPEPSREPESSSESAPPTERHCRKCNQTKPLDQFYSAGRKPDGSIRLDSYCRLCRLERSRQYQAEKRARQPPKPPKPPRTDKWCPRCQSVKPLSEYQIRKGSGRNHGQPQAYCKDCDRAYHVEYQRRWRQENPDKLHAQNIREWQRVKADPQRYAEYLDNVRIYHRLRREKNGLPLEVDRKFKVIDGQSDPRLPAGPMQEWIRARSERYGGIQVLAQLIRCDPRALTSVFDRESIELSKVDRLLTREGSTLIHEIYPDWA